jgi:hypothetical protein
MKNRKKRVGNVPMFVSSAGKKPDRGCVCSSDVVFTIYNSSAENVDKTGILSKKKNVVTSIKEKLAVPLVVANAK